MGSSKKMRAAEVLLFVRLKNQLKFHLFSYFLTFFIEVSLRFLLIQLGWGDFFKFFRS